MFNFLMALIGFMMAVSGDESQDSIDKKFEELLKEQEESQKIHEQNVEESNKLHNKDIEISNILHQEEINEINKLKKIINDNNINSSVSKNDLKDFINEIEPKINEIPDNIISETQKSEILASFEKIRSKLSDSPKM